MTRRFSTTRQGVILVFSESARTQLRSTFEAIPVQCSPLSNAKVRNRPMTVLTCSPLQKTARNQLDWQVFDGMTGKVVKLTDRVTKRQAQEDLGLTHGTFYRYLDLVTEMSKQLKKECGRNTITQQVVKAVEKIAILRNEGLGYEEIKDEIIAGRIRL